jgi:hypothetical protein
VNDGKGAQQRIRYVDQCLDDYKISNIVVILIEGVIKIRHLVCLGTLFYDSVEGASAAHKISSPAGLSSASNNNNQKG